MEIKTVSLDDMLNPEDLAKLKARRKAKSVHDLSDLIPKRDLPPPIEILEAVQVIFFSQINTCLNCKGEVRWPTGLVAMHKLKRHGRMTNELAGIALTAGNQHPGIPRVHQTAHSTSIVCANCVDEARFIERPSKEPPIPSVLSPEWYEQHRCAQTEEIRKIEEFQRRKAEQLRRELGEDAPTKPDTADIPEEILVLGNSMIEIPAEPTDPADTQ